MIPQATELKVWLKLPNGLAALAVIAVVEEGMPTPGETDTHREPSAREMDDISSELINRRWHYSKPQ